MKSIEKTFAWKAVIRLNQAILVMASIAIVVIIVAGVYVRYVLKSDIFGIEEILVIVAMWLYWMAGVYASYENTHLRADIIEHLIKSNKKRKIYSIVVQVITIASIALFTKWGLDYAAWNIQLGATTPGIGLPLLISQIPLTISFCMMLLFSLYHLYRTIFPQKPDEEVNA
jgi:TRAP-type C4-dicarboxylate transport system permease small subunit